MISRRIRARHYKSRRVTKTLFWGSAGLLTYAQAGYPLALYGFKRLRERRNSADTQSHRVVDELPFVSLIIAAHNEEKVIHDKVRNAYALHYPRHLFEVIVTSDGSKDRTVERAQSAGADVVLDLPHGGKVRAQDAAVEKAKGSILVFSDANAIWDQEALQELIKPFSDQTVGYVCGQVQFVNAENGTSQEGLYWRYEMMIRGCESLLSSVTAGNGAIYAVRREAYICVDPVMGHDLSFPFNIVKRGRKALYQPSAKATEKMVPSIEGEFARKRRMMSHAWPIVIRGGMLSPKGYSPLYGGMIFSHRVLRYFAPFLHSITLVTNVVLLRHTPRYKHIFAVQIALASTAALSATPKYRPLLVARHYVLMLAAVTLGGYDWLKHGTPAGWDAPEGTR